MGMDGNGMAIALILSILFSTYCGTLIYGIVMDCRLRRLRRELRSKQNDVEAASVDIPRPTVAHLSRSIQLNDLPSDINTAGANHATSSPVLRSANSILHHPSPCYPARLQRARSRLEACTNSCCRDPFQLESALPAAATLNASRLASPSSVYSSSPENNNPFASREDNDDSDDSVTVVVALDDGTFTIGSDDEGEGEGEGEDEDYLNDLVTIDLDDPLGYEVSGKEAFPGGWI